MVVGTIAMAAVLTSARSVATARVHVGRCPAKLAQAVRAAGQRGRQKGQIISEGRRCGGRGRLVIADLLLLELSHEVLGRVEVFARLARAFALDEIDADGNERVLGVDRTMRGRVRKRALAGLLLTVPALEIATYLR